MKIKQNTECTQKLKWVGNSAIKIRTCFKYPPTQVRISTIVDIIQWGSSV